MLSERGTTATSAAAAVRQQESLQCSPHTNLCSNLELGCCPAASCPLRTGWVSLWGMVFTYLPGVLVCYMQLFTRRPAVRLPRWLKAWMDGRKQLGLLSLFTSECRAPALAAHMPCAACTSLWHAPPCGVHLPVVWQVFGHSGLPRTPKHSSLTQTPTPASNNQDTIWQRRVTL